MALDLKKYNITNISADSRKIKPQGCFIAAPGINNDGSVYIPEAIANGAKLILTHRHIINAEQYNAEIIVIPDWYNNIGNIVAEFYKNTNKNLTIFGVTGTNGKTTVSIFIAQILDLLNKKPGIKCGIIGTLGFGTVDNLTKHNYTTPDLVTVHDIINQQYHNLGVQAISMEVSSHALDQHRLAAVPIKYGIFTNLSHDHLDYHINMENYAAAKYKLFTNFKLEKAIFNIDDDYGRKFYDAYPYEKIAISINNRLINNNINNKNLLQAEIIHQNLEKSLLAIIGPFGKKLCETNVIGDFNISNLLASIAAVWAAGYNIDDIINTIPKLQPILGRMQLVHILPSILIDYAHTPDGLAKVCSNLSKYIKPNNKLILVFGCGGNRDKLKRPAMAKIAEQYAQHIIVTQDNSRDEDPQAIIADIIAGFKQQQNMPKNIQVILDRREAIFEAVKLATANDIVLIVGKGHEMTQILQDKILPFSDAQEAEYAIASAKGIRHLQELLLAGKIRQFTVDSRKVKSKDVFVAIPGARVDGHDFIDAALKLGVQAVLANQEYFSANPDINPSIIKVANTRQSLIALSSWYRDKFNIPFVGITGSQGKTSVKNLLVNILSELGAVHYSEGNLNTDIGVPMSLLQLKPEHQFSVIEMGARNIGDISLLAKLVKPKVTVINNIGSAHIEVFGSKLNIAKAKGEIYDNLPPDGIAVVNLDDEFAALWLQDLQARQIKTITFAINNKQADIIATNITVQAQQVAFSVQDMQINLLLPSLHNIYNALAAMGVAMALGVDLKSMQAGLAKVTAVPGRLSFNTGFQQALIIDDTYNASFDAVKSAIEVLSQQDYQKKYLVFGGMRELGQYSQDFHTAIGKYAKSLNIDALFTIGEDTKWTADAFGTSAWHFNDKNSLIKHIKNYLNQHSAILIKGARSMYMEEVVKELLC